MAQYIKIDKEGNKFWYKDKEMKIIHREDGPAIEYVDGSRSWYFDGKRHREDGPAIEWIKGYTKWYLNGVEYTKAQFDDTLTRKYVDSVINDEIQRAISNAAKILYAEIVKEIEEDGIEMTIPEIESSLGYPIKIVSDHLA